MYRMEANGLLVISRKFLLVESIAALNKSKHKERTMPLWAKAHGSVRNPDPLKAISHK